jgi:hypothetical protein
MPDTIIAVLLTGASNVLILAVTLYFQSRRDERAQRNARLERLRAAYRLLLQADRAIVRAASRSANLQNDVEKDRDLNQRIKAQVDGAIKLYNRAWIELTLESEYILLDADPEVLSEYSKFRAKLSRAQAKPSSLTDEDMSALTADLRAAETQRRHNIQDRLAELEAPADKRGRWR